MHGGGGNLDHFDADRSEVKAGGGERFLGPATVSAEAAESLLENRGSGDSAGRAESREQRAASLRRSS